MLDFATVAVNYNETRSDGNFAWPVKYDLKMVDGVATLNQKIRFTGDAPPANLLQLWDSGIDTIWNKRVFYSDGTRLYEIIITSDFVTSGEHIVIQFHNHAGGWDAGNWYATSTNVTSQDQQDKVAAHEFGHNIGVFDEYAGGATYGGYVTTGTLMSDLSISGFENYYWTMEYYIEQYAQLALTTQLARRGTAAHDANTGTAGMDGMYGLLGDDTLSGLGGNDYIVGDEGSDNLKGGDGDDIVKGGVGDDTLDGGAGQNTLDGGDGADVVVIEKSRYLYERQDTPTGLKLVGTGLAQGEVYDIRNVEKYVFKNAPPSLLQDFEPLGSTTMARNDDGSSSYVDLSGVFLNGINFYGSQFNGLYVNNNGNVTFGSSLSTYTPGTIGGGTTLKIIAPFWADVDTRLIPATTERPNPPENGQVYWKIDPVRGAFTATWFNVGYYSTQASNYQHKVDSFQLQLIDAGSGDFDIIFRYDTINWTTGNASGGTNGLGGTPARAGFSAGDGIAGHYYELPQSGSQAGMLGLPDADGSGGSIGVWRFRVSNGSIQGLGGDGSDTMLATDDNHFLDGGGGDDWQFGNSGNDFLYGRAGADYLNGGEGANVMEGGAGGDFLVGGGGGDTIVGNGGSSAAGDGLDIAFSGGGDDEIRVGGHGAIYAEAGDGDDRMTGGDDPGPGGGVGDYLFGQNGNDSIVGGGGNDYLVGGAGNDTIVGGGGASDPGQFDIVLGGDGDDVISQGASGRLFALGEAGNDTITGGDATLPGADVTEYLFGGDGSDSIAGGAGADALVGSHYEPVGDGAQVDTLFGGDGADYVLQGYWGRGVLNGGAGADTIVGAGGADTIIFGLGDDYAYGLGGADLYYVAIGDVATGQTDTILDFDAAGGDRLAFAGVAAANVSFVDVAGFGAGAYVATGDGFHAILAANTSAALLQWSTSFG